MFISNKFLLRHNAFSTVYENRGWTALDVNPRRGLIKILLLILFIFIRIWLKENVFIIHQNTFHAKERVGCAISRTAYMSTAFTLNTEKYSLQTKKHSGLTRHTVGTYQENELTRNSSGNTRSQSSQLAELLWTDPRA